MNVQNGIPCKFLKTFSVKRGSQTFLLESPLCVLYSRTGCIPHLTKETLQYLNPKLLSNIYQLPFPTVVDHTDTLEAICCGAAECFSLPNDCLTYSSIKDESRKAHRGYNTKSTVAVWGIGGRINVSPQMYMKSIKAIKPDIFQVLSDGDVAESDSRKRIVKSVQRSVIFLEECLKLYKESEELKDSVILSMIQGGNLFAERKHCIELIHEKLKESEVETWGYVFDGLPNDGVLSDKWKYLVKSTIELLPQDKAVVVHEVGHPVNVIDLVQCGVSIFDSSYATVMAEEHKALSFAYENSSIKHADNCENEKSDDNTLLFSDTICLSDSCYAQSFTPLVENCPCYTCTHHTKAYIHHLIVVNEMLAPVLLTLHNLHHYLSFFQALRNELKICNHLDSFRARLLHLNAKA